MRKARNWTGCWQRGLHKLDSDLQGLIPLSTNLLLSQCHTVTQPQTPYPPACAFQIQKIHLKSLSVPPLILLLSIIFLYLQSSWKAKWNQQLGGTPLSALSLVFKRFIGLDTNSSLNTAAFTQHAFKSTVQTGFNMETVAPNIQPAHVVRNNQIIWIPPSWGPLNQDEKSDKSLWQHTKDSLLWD